MMHKVQKPKNEIQRLDALAALQILDTPPEPVFDQLTELAKEMFDVPIVIISLIDKERQWFKSCIGLDIDSTSREVAFCDLAIRADAVMIVPDTTVDPRFSDNALVTGAPHIRFYAGAPLRFNDVLVGTICVIDRVPRASFGSDEARKLEKLAAAVSSAMLMRREALANIATIKEREAARKTLDLAEDVAGVGRWSLDVKTGKVQWSEQVFRIHGIPVTPQALDYRDALSYYDEADGRLLEELVKRALTTGEGYELEARIRRPDGLMRNVIAKAMCFRGQDGAIETLHGVFQDVTDFRLAIDEARQSEAKYRLLAENMPGLLGYWDSDLLCRFANKAYLEWFNKAPEELMGLHIRSVLGEELFARNQYYIRGALAGKKQTFERAITKGNGEVGYTLAQYLPDFNDKGSVRGFFVLVTDITNQKLREMALADSNAQLIDAREEAEAALEIKAQFLATMSHEIRTPLTTILGYANLLERQGEMSEESDGFVRRIGNAGRTLLELINDVLDVSRLEAGKVALSPQATNVNELAHDILEQFQMRASTQNLILTLCYHDDLPAWQLIDGTRLRQVLSNLIDNACKFTAEGVLAVTMRAVDSSSGAHMRVEVSDPGPGMSAEQAGKLFKRFQQLDTGLNRSHGGSGLGLAICREIVKLMQGEIGLITDVASGSTFWFEIPLTLASPISIDERDTHFVEFDAKDRKVLIVEDHAVNRKMIKALLLPYAAAVVEAADGTEAIAICQVMKFDLILMDIQMPHIDGVAATRTIRETCPRNASTPIVALTALSSSQLPLADVQSLFNEVLTKPIDPRTFQAMVSARMRQNG